MSKIPLATINTQQNEFISQRLFAPMLARLANHKTTQLEPESLATSPLRIAIAYSGGLDSSVLLHVAHQVCPPEIQLFAFHVHHGISPHADAWLAHCSDTCERLAVPFASRHISLRYGQGEGIEQAAREQRYAALGEMCREHGVTHLLTAHHLDDQAETVLLQMLRGSGVAGLVAMDSQNYAPDLLGSPDILLMRPLLASSRQQLENFAKQQHITHIEDESNSDPRYTRNALRLAVMPQLAQDFPGFQVRLARTAEHARAAQSLLEEVAQQDLLLCEEGGQLLVGPLLQLRSERRDNLFRYWLAQHGKRMPATAWLREMWQQLATTDENAQPCIIHPECQIHLYHGRVYLTPRYDLQLPSDAPANVVWHGEASLAFPTFHGCLHFEASATGLPRSWLQGKTLQLDYRQGGERLRLGHNRPSRSLKQHYQAAKIPSWQRERTPLLSYQGQLLFVPGLGLASEFVPLAEETKDCVQLRWQPDL